MRAFLLFFGGWVAVCIVHDLMVAAIARTFGHTVTVFSVFIGPRLAAVSLGGTEVRLNALPLGGSVKFSAAFQPPQHIAVRAGANAIVLVLAGTAMGLLSAFGLFAGFWWDAVTGGAVPFDSMYARSLLAALEAFIEVTPTAMALGMVAILTTVLNLLPLPTLDGGEILIAVIETVRPIRPQIKEKLDLIGLVGVLVLLTLWSYHFVSYVWSQF